MNIESLRKELPHGKLETGESLVRYAEDCWPQSMAWDKDSRRAHTPAAAALPADEKETAAILAWASRENVSLVPRGAGSGVLGSAIPDSPKSVILDASRLTKTFDISPGTTPQLRVGAGWLGGELERRLNEEGYSLLHFPASMEISSVGGWIALASFGQLSTRFGGIGDQAVSLRAALPDGSLRDEDPAIHLGAEGTLGVVTEATLKIRRLPSKREFYAFEFHGPQAALAFARRAAEADIPPSVLRLYSPVDAILTGLRKKKPSGAGKGLLGTLEPFLMRHHRWVSALAPLAGDRWLAVLIYEEEDGFKEIGTPPSPEEGRPLGPRPAQVWWEKRYHWSKERLERVFARGCFADTVDLWAPWDKLAALESAVRRALSPHAFAFGHYSHFDREGACLYVTFAGSGDPAQHAAAWAGAMEACRKIGGRINHHHGIGMAKLPWLSSGWSKDWLEKLRGEKTARDPRGLLNPGKLEAVPCP